MWNPNALDAINRLTSEIESMQKSADMASRFAQQVQEQINKHALGFDRFVMDDRLTKVMREINESRDRLEAGFKRHNEAQLLVSATLPSLGWYLNGREAITFSLTLADAIREKNWKKVNQEMITSLPEFKMDALETWARENGIRDFSFNRIRLFLMHHRENRHEEATYLGIPLIDEIAQALYSGKSFTTKRGRGANQSKPELAFKTSSGPEVSDYCSAFIQAFGSLQEDPDRARLDDEDYWNRHAIVHGMMRRAMGPKDSAKCLMAISFLLFAREDTQKSSDS